MHCEIKKKKQLMFSNVHLTNRQIIEIKIFFSDSNLVAILKTSMAQAAMETKTKIVL